MTNDLALKVAHAMGDHTWDDAPIRLSFFVPGEAVAKGRPRAAVIGGKARLYTPAKTVSYEKLVAGLGKEAMGQRAPLDGPCRLYLTIYRTIPASWPKRKQQDANNGAIWPTGKPDLDNIIKAVADALNGVAFVDDSQLVSVSASKQYAAGAGGVFVRVLEGAR